MLNEYLQRQPNLGQARVLKIGAWVVTVLVLALVALMREFKFDLPCLLYTSPSPRDKRQSRMPSSA